MYRCFLLGLFLCCALSSLEQVSNRYQYHTIPGEEFQELPDQTIYSITEDASGLLWFSTSLGLYKFDGYNFTLVTSPNKKGRAVFEFTVNGKKVFFTNVYGQLSEAEDDTLKLLFDLSNLSNGSVPKYVKRDGQFYIGLKSGLFLIDFKGKSIVSNDYVLGLTSYFDRVIYVNDHGLLKTINEAGNIETLQSLIVDAERINHVSFAEGLKNERLLIYQLDGVNHFKFFDSRGSLTPLKVPEVISKLNVNHVYLEKNKSLSFIVSTEQGCYRLEYSKKGTISKEEKLLSADYNFTSAIRERGGHIMVSTMNNGYFILPDQKIECIDISEDDEVETFTVLNSDVFVTGSIDGVLKIYDTGGLSNQIQLPNHSKIEKIIFLKSSGILLINTNSNYGYTYRLSDGNLKKNMSLVATKDLYPINESTILHGTFDRLSILSLWDEAAEEVLIDSRTMRIVFDSLNQQFYAATLKGVYVFNNRLDSLRKIKSDNNTILLDLEIVDSHVFGISNNQLFLIKDGRLHKITEFNGVIKDIQGDTRDNVIWINTTNGIFSFNPRTGERNMYDVSIMFTT